jgi:hypothetical protein
MDDNVELLFDGGIATAISGVEYLVTSSPENRLAQDKLVLARNLQVCREAIWETAVKC